MSEQYDNLLAALSAVPKLDGALCAGQWELFDDTDDDYVIAFTIGQCQQCPALDACTTWVASLPAHSRPHGVCAGELRGTHTAPKKAAS